MYAVHTSSSSSLMNHHQPKSRMQYQTILLLKYNTTQHNSTHPTQCNAMQCNATRRDAITQYNTIQYNTSQHCNTTQCNIYMSQRILHNTVQYYNIIMCWRVSILPHIVLACCTVLDSSSSRYTPQHPQPIPSNHKWPAQSMILIYWCLSSASSSHPQLIVGVLYWCCF